MVNAQFFGSDCLLGRSRRGVTAQNEVRKLHLLSKKFSPGCVITLDTLGNCIVDQVFHVGGLKDLQDLCVCDDDPTGTRLLPTGIPEKYSDRGSPYDENFLFGNAGLSFTDLNNKDIVLFTVKWSKPHTLVAQGLIHQ